MTRRRRRGTGGIIGGLLIALQPTLLACPICFQVEPGAVSNGVRAAVVVLVGVTSAVLTGFAVFIARFARREARL
jgi:hypothetical protein